MRLLSLAFVVGLLVGVLPLLFGLKTIEEYYRNSVPKLVVTATTAPSTVTAPPATRPVDTRAYRAAAFGGVIRRLDDYSFWNTLGTVLTGALILLAAYVMRSGYRLRWWYWMTATAVAGLLSWGYVAVMFNRKETFGHWAGPEAEGEVSLLQFIEGIAFVGVIVLGSLLLVYALAVLGAVGKMHDAAVKSNSGAGQAPMLKAAGLLHTAALGPPILVVVGMFISTSIKALGVWQEWNANWSDFWIRLLVLVILYLPFLILVLAIRHRLPALQFTFELKEPWKVLRMIAGLFGIKPPPLIYFSAAFRNNQLNDEALASKSGTIEQEVWRSGEHDGGAP
jgi:hypothetical protein